MVLGLLSSAALADECTPEWDPTFGVPGANTGIVFDLVTHDDGNGTAMYVSGSFTSIGGTAANRIARWNGANWARLGSGLSNNEVYAIESFDGKLFAAGYFDSAGGVAGTAKLASWNGNAWESLDAQLELFSNQLWALATWDDGQGEALYIAGNFENVGGVNNASFIAKYDGENFSSLGTPISGAGVPLIVFSAHTWDDGDGEALYVGGRFLSIDGVPASRIAKWDGSNWSALGSGIDGPLAPSSVNAMVAFDDGTGEQLYVAGQAFTSAGGQPANRVARWDGSQWSSVGDGFADGIVWGLEVFDDGNGPALYAFGTFTASGTTPIDRIARWNGTVWEQVGAGANGATYRGLAYDDGNGSAMFVGGAYTTIGGVTANRISRFVACEDDGIPGDINGDGEVNVDDLLIVLNNWGECGDCGDCPADVTGDCHVNVDDLLIVLNSWG